MQQLSDADVEILTELLGPPVPEPLPPDDDVATDWTSQELRQEIVSPVDLLFSVASSSHATCQIQSCRNRIVRHSHCYKHGGIEFCRVEGCGIQDKSSSRQTGKTCRHPGCTKSIQKFGLCHKHGGKRCCKVEGCHRKDRGKGLCVKHGGGKKCSADGCDRGVRRGNHCAHHSTTS